MNLLAQQDSFMVCNLSYFLSNYEYTDGNQANINFSSNSFWGPITYSATNENNSSEPSFSPGCDMFWIGAYLSVEVNKHMLIPKWDCYRHYKVPVMQSATGAIIPNPLQGFQSAHDGSVDGFYTVQPNVTFGGARGNNVKLNLPANIPSTMKPFNLNVYNVSYIAKANIVFRGILLQNSTIMK